jgi:hypothetical protein
VTPVTLQRRTSISMLGQASLCADRCGAGVSREPLTARPSRHDVSIGRIRDSGIAWVAIMMGLPVTAALLLPVLFPDETCVDLWNAPDNAAVRTQVAEAGFESAGITSDTFEGPGRVCYVTLFDGAREARATYVIWPDNLFDNGSLHDYAGPFAGNFGYDGRQIDEPTPHLTVSSSGHLLSG